MSNTVRRALVWTMNGEYTTRRQARTLQAERKRTRRLDRRMHAVATREALVNYYDDLSWIEKLEAELYAFADKYDSWEDASMYDLTWEDTEVDLLDSDIFDDCPDYGWAAWEERYA